MEVLIMTKLKGSAFFFGRLKVVRKSNTCFCFKTKGFLLTEHTYMKTKSSLCLDWTFKPEEWNYSHSTVQGFLQVMEASQQGPSYHFDLARTDDARYSWIFSCLVWFKGHRQWRACVASPLKHMFRTLNVRMSKCRQRRASLATNKYIPIKNTDKQIYTPIKNTNKHIRLNLECKNQAWLSWALFVCLHSSRSQKSQVLAALSTFISGTGYAIKEIRIPRVFFFFPFLLSISTAHIQQQKIQIFKPK